jgi:hypothetical protein
MCTWEKKVFVNGSEYCQEVEICPSLAGITLYGSRETLAMQPRQLGALQPPPFKPDCSHHLHKHTH